MTSATSTEPPAVCAACGDGLGRWGAVRVGNQPVRLNNLVMVARSCVGCGTIEMRGNEAPAAPPAGTPGRAILSGFVSNVAEAMRAVLRAARDRLRRGQ